jgi:hypothetical protein
MNKNIPAPSTLEEAMETLTKLLSPEEQVNFTRMSEDEVGGLHHSFGMWLRNNWGLWDENSAMCQHMKSLGFMHADDMSGSLMREFWARMNNLPSKLAEEIQYYKEFWAKAGNKS